MFCLQDMIVQWENKICQSNQIIFNLFEGPLRKMEAIPNTVSVAKTNRVASIDNKVNLNIIVL